MEQGRQSHIELSLCMYWHGDMGHAHESVLCHVARMTWVDVNDVGL